MGTKTIETEINREKIYNYVKANPNCNLQECADALGFSKAQADYYARLLVLRKHLNKKLVYVNSKRSGLYTLGPKLFVRKIKTDEEQTAIKVEKILDKLPPEVRAVSRIVSLSDKNMQPPRSKKKRRSGFAGHMQSSMGLFNAL